MDQRRGAGGARLAGPQGGPKRAVRLLRSPELPQRALFARSIDAFRRAGAPLGAHRAEQLQGAPSEREQRIAQAIAGQLDLIGTTADTLVLGEQAGVSPRQLQRIYARLCSTYGMNLASWRDTRNRWRLQIAAVLLSRTDLSLSEIAGETGYRSPQAMARAFLHAGLPSPSDVRRLLLPGYSTAPSLPRDRS